MKKIILVLLMFLLVGCSSGLDLKYEKNMSVDVWWEDGTSFNITDEKVIESLFDLLNEAKLEKLSASDQSAYAYFIQLDNQTSIRLTNQLIIGLDGDDYVFDTDQKSSVEGLLSNYLPAEDLVVVELETDNDEKEETIDTSGYQLAGKLDDGSEIFYLIMDSYYHLERVSKIIRVTSNGSLVISEGELSIPDINPNGDTMTFVDGVGFEYKGVLKLYRDGKIIDVDSEELAAKEEQSRTLKSSIWYSNNQLICLLGYDSGTVSQGGDVYLINVDTGKTKMLIDSKEGKEITHLSFEVPYLTYEVVTWIDNSYQQYYYEEKTVDISDLSSGYPIKEEWQESNTNLSYLSSDEITSLDLFDSNLTMDDMVYFERKDDGYHDGAVVYTFKESSDMVWKIEVNGEVAFDMPRDIKFGDTFESVLAKFPIEKNYLKDAGLIYGLEVEENENQYETGHIIVAGQQLEMVLKIQENQPIMRVIFNEGLVKKIQVLFFD